MFPGRHSTLALHEFAHWPAGARRDTTSRALVSLTTIGAGDGTIDLWRWRRVSSRRVTNLGGRVQEVWMTALESVKALAFDVFGTVVDWRSSITREGEALGRAKGLTVDWARFADAWRGLYQPMLSRVRNGELPWTKLDDLHRMSLDRLLVDFGVAGLSEADIDHLNRAWHRLDPWPDAVAGLTRLRHRFILATCSNGNVALMVNMARRAGLPWDAILGAEVARHYKPQPEAYRITVDMLGLRPEQCMMVAAHNGDLAAAAGCGLRTAFVPRPLEHGPGQSTDLTPTREHDVVATDFVDLAKKLGC